MQYEIWEGGVALQPKLSIIVPVYNVAELIDATLTSVLSQSFRDFELILVDDGSTDGTKEMLETPKTVFKPFSVRVKITRSS